MAIREPTLSAKEPDIPTLLSKLRYPKAVSPKMDGIRAFVENSVVLSRSRKLIPNMHVQAMLGQSKYEGLDGELCVGNPWDLNLMQQTSSGTRSRDGKPDFHFYVFDRWNTDRSFMERNASVRDLHGGVVRHVPHEIILNEADLLAYEDKCLERGYEGVMLRDPMGPYIDKRSSMTDQYLVAMKRREDSEAVIISVHEKMHNNNEATKNETGRTQRLGGKKGHTGLGTLGGFVCMWPETGAKFNMGTGKGFNDKERARLWAMRDKLPGLPAKFSFVRVGMKNGVPRLPLFLGIRDGFDI